MRPPDPSQAWSAEIEWGRLDGEAGFRVSVHQGAGSPPTTLAESPPLAWPPSGRDSIEALTSAVRTLEASLLAAGWRRLATGDAWYAGRFAWEPVATSEPADARAPADDEVPRLKLVPPVFEQEAPPPTRPPGPFARTPAWPEGARELWRCEIAWNAGWAESQFEAVVYPPKGRRGRAIGASSGPRWLLMRQPDGTSPESQAAVHRLAAALVAAGWSPAGIGLSWYSQRFLWKRDGKPPDPAKPVDSGPVQGD